ncbi:hypothetical protein RND81_02G203100 [Saponaria officinalis]|uniref:Exonuclease domain-containing protein n=1 Tax=Saponaria officinalis TaxID=3572 RepID=A0AAW1MVD4_SAPOF
MNFISNAFSVLGFEDGDADPSSLTSTSEPGQSTNNGKRSNDELVVENGNNKEPELGAWVSEFKKPLVWIDLEMTGLNLEVDRIIEIACIITDGNLSKSAEGPDLVIHQTQECLDRMNEWCQNHHTASGLTNEVLRSTLSEREAEEQVIKFLKRHVGRTHRPLLAGNSVYTDFMFLKKYMPELARMFSHVLVDVSSIRALCIRWYPKALKKAPEKEKKHRAMDDIRESVMELKYYRENIFIKPPKK